jgi:hypothetical protein
MKTRLRFPVTSNTAFKKIDLNTSLELYKIVCDDVWNTAFFKTDKTSKNPVICHNLVNHTPDF